MTKQRLSRSITVCLIIAAAGATNWVSCSSVINCVAPTSPSPTIATGSQRLNTTTLDTPRPRPLCQVGDNQTPYVQGKWVRNESISEYPYVGGQDDYEWGPLCTEMEKEYQQTGKIPEFLKYQWRPESCDLAPFDRETTCRLLDSKIIGVIGDSTQQHFVHSFIGLMLGHLNNEGFFVPPDYGKLMVDLCPGSQYSVTLVFRRWNKYQGTEEDRKILQEIAQISDYLVVNWGVHYQPWNEMEKATLDFMQILEDHWQPPEKKPQRLFWRSTIAAHDNCASANAPAESAEHALNKNPVYNTNEIMLQDQQIVQPLLKFSPALDVTFLRIEKSTLMRPDGHRVVGHKGAEDCLHYCEPGPTDSWVVLFLHHVFMGI